MADEMSFEELLASPHLQFDLDRELLPHLIAFGPPKPTRRPWLFDAATSTTVVVSDSSEGSPVADPPPASVLRIEGDDDIRLVLNGLDSLTFQGETPVQRRAAYDLLLRLRCRMGSDGRWRQDPPDNSEVPNG